MPISATWSFRRLPAALSRGLRRDLFQWIADVAEQQQTEVYVVGGFVRDLLLGRPSKDVDILVVGSGIRFAQHLADKLPEERQLAYFKNFGTAQLKWQGLEIEFVGARKESYQRHSRKPIVEEGSLEEDLLRRDFTINALAVWLGPQGRFRLLDPFQGQQHLRQGLIETPQDPQITFSDDPLRMMRAVRFAAQLDFTLSERIQTAIREQAQRLEIVSDERVTEELNKILAAPQPSVGFKWMERLGLLPGVLPELEAMKGVETIDDQSHKDNFLHTLQVLDNVAQESDDLWLRWAALLHDIGKPRTKRYDPEQGWTFHGHEVVGERMVPQIFKRLRLPLNDKMKFVRKLVGLHHRPIALIREVTDSAVRRLIVDADEDLDALFTLCRADITSKNLQRKERYLRNFDRVREKIDEVADRDRLRNWKPPVDGTQIMALFNLTPSREVGDLKNGVREAILNGDIPNRTTDALLYVKEKGEAKGLTPQADVWEDLMAHAQQKELSDE
jgi:poly(A) polymerase